MDFEAAFKREREARKQAENILEDKSRELFLSNQELSEQYEALQDSALKSQIFIRINRYSIDKTLLRDFLPGLVVDMIKLVDMPFCLFDHHSFHQGVEAYRSDVFINNTLPYTQGLPESTNERVMDDLVDKISAMLMEKKEFLIVDNIENHDNTPQGKEIIAKFNLRAIIAIPILSHERVAGIVYLLASDLTEKQKNVMTLFQDALLQLGYMIEHRFQEELLQNSLDELKKSNAALESAQQQLVQSEKMASIGQLSAGVAHEINNPMGYIKSNITSLTDYIDDFKQYIAEAEKIRLMLNETNHEALNADHVAALDKVVASIDLTFLLEDTDNLLDESKAGIDRVVDIVSGLKRFSRQSDNTKEICSIQEIVEEALKLAHNELKYNVEVSTDYDDVGGVRANSGELIQVFLNMLINSGHAVGEHGSVHLSIKEYNSGVQILIEDNGCGIDSDSLEKIFDPFFTTKEVGVGTGLGLSISYGIIEDHNGSITVDSQLDQGTTFKIWLPYDATE